MADGTNPGHKAAKAARVAGGIGVVAGLAIAALGGLADMGLVGRLTAMLPGLGLALLGIVAICIGVATDALVDTVTQLRRIARDRPGPPIKRDGPLPEAVAPPAPMVPASVRPDPPESPPAKPRLVAPAAEAGTRGRGPAHPIFSAKPPR